MEVAEDCLRKAGVADCKLERGHGDGRIVQGRDRHILVVILLRQGHSPEKWAPDTV